jgi:TonB family protein
MFEPVYGRAQAGESPYPGVAASLVIHGLAWVALVASGGHPAAVMEQVTEGIVFLAPRPSATAGPTAVTERLRYVEFQTLVGAIADDGSDLHTGGKVATPLLQLEETLLGPRIDATTNIFERTADSVYFAEQVDSPAAYDDRSAAPAYPDSLQRLGIEGSVMAQFIVDTTGHVEMETVRLIESTNLRFTESVLAALPHMLFRPAVLNGIKARQVVEVPFRFRVVKDTARTRDTVSVRQP